MESAETLRVLLVIFAVALVVVTALRRLGVPPIAGFIFAGALAGPRALSLIPDSRSVEVLAEIGVVLLLFGIGLELSLSRVKRLWKLVIVGGALQVSLTMGVAAGVALALGLAWPQALFAGMLLAVSSTAIVLRSLEQRGETESPHGRLILGILIFQDLAVIPMLLLLPVLSGTVTPGWDLALSLLKALGVLTGVLVASRFIVPRALSVVARTRQRELFVLAVFLVCIGTAWVSALAGISLSLGAFLGGLVVADSEFRHQALAEVLPIKEVLTSLFFVSVGMLLDPVLLWHSAGTVILLLLGLLTGKFVIVVIVGFLMRLPLRVTILSATALAQVGEFFFVLSTTADGSVILDGSLLGDLSAAAVLSMFVTPVVLRFGPAIATGAHRVLAVTRLMRVTSAEEAHQRFSQRNDHVIVAGYGFAGRELAAALKNCGVDFVIVDLRSENVQAAAADGHDAVLGDVTSPNVLDHLGASHARMLVVAINDPRAAAQAIRAASRTAGDLHVVARALYLADRRELAEAGADSIVFAEVEAAAAVVEQVLAHCPIEAEQLERTLRELRLRGAVGRRTRERQRPRG
jgi:CPA2 family monovalent cation:H+ antiporter-2